MELKYLPLCNHDVNALVLLEHGFSCGWVSAYKVVVLLNLR